MRMEMRRMRGRNAYFTAWGTAMRTGDG